MMRTFLKAVIVVALAIAVLSYVSYLISGRFWLPRFITDGVQSPVLLEPTMGPPSISQPTYKWLEKGQWVYGDVPPPGVEAIAVHEDQK